MDADNWALVTDLYELTMANGFKEKLGEEEGVFDIFFRKMPDDGSFVVLAGLEQAVEELKNFHFEKEDIDYLKGLNLFSDDFIEYLADFKFSCRVWAVPEGTPIFPREPVMTIQGPLIQAQLFETLLLSIINHETLIATKARRITAAAKGRGVMEFGARRAQGPSSATYGARAAVIGGASSTSNLLAAKKFGIPAAGTMAHSWIEAFDSEYDAFRAWADIYPDNCSLLADTYDVLESGVPNAIKIFNELKAEGHDNFGIRIDSGDVTKLAEAAREMMDEAGFPNAKITISNALDENIIQSLLEQGAPIDNFGVGEKMITSSSSPVLSGVYKLSAVIKGDKLIPKIKVSESKGKLTLPGIKQTYRLIDNKSAKPLPILSRFVTRIFRPNSRLSRLIRWQRNKRVILQTLRRFLFKKKPWTGLKLKSIFQTSLRSKSSAILSSICFRIQRSACSMRMNIRCSSRQNFMKFSKNSFQNLRINK